MCFKSMTIFSTCKSDRGIIGTWVLIINKINFFKKTNKQTITTMSKQQGIQQKKHGLK